MSESQVRPIRVVQVTDSHLFASEEGRLLGLRTEESLQHVLALVRQEQPAMDLLLITGDISQDGSLVAYQRFLGYIETFGVPYCWLQGNHDLSPVMARTLGGAVDRLAPCTVRQGNWTIVLLDTSVENEVFGALDAGDLVYLDQALSDARGTHVMVCIHHNPIPTGSGWLDQHILQNPEQLFRVLDRHDHVRAVVWGHVHQVQDAERNGVRLLSAPSTSVQFKPGSQDFAIDDLPPGYRWFDLYPDGHFDTQVSRVQGVHFEIDVNSTGY